MARNLPTYVKKIANLTTTSAAVVDKLRGQGHHSHLEGGVELSDLPIPYKDEANLIKNISNKIATFLEGDQEITQADIEWVRQKQTNAAFKKWLAPMEAAYKRQEDLAQQKFERINAEIDKQWEVEKKKTHELYPWIDLDCVKFGCTKRHFYRLKNMEAYGDIKPKKSGGNFMRSAIGLGPTRDEQLETLENTNLIPDYNPGKMNPDYKHKKFDERRYRQRLLEQRLQGKGIGDAVDKTSQLLFKPDNATAFQHTHNFKLDSQMPAKATLQKIVDASYKPDGERPETIGKYQKVMGTATLVFYQRGNIIIVGVRGTADGTDVKADSLIAVGMLTSSARYKKDAKDLATFQKQYPVSQFTYFGVGHSLGGALVDKFLATGKLKQAVSYNPAVEKKDLQNTNHYRVYMESDPLYNTMGKYATNVETRKGKATGFWQRIYQLTSMGKAHNALKAHQLGNFEGGCKLCGKKTKIYGRIIV
jgi:hypothetical protein